MDIHTDACYLGDILDTSVQTARCCSWIMANYFFNKTCKNPTASRLKPCVCGGWQCSAGVRYSSATVSPPAAYLVVGVRGGCLSQRWKVSFFPPESLRQPQKQLKIPKRLGPSEVFRWRRGCSGRCNPSFTLLVDENLRRKLRPPPSTFGTPRTESPKNLVPGRKIQIFW